MKDLQNLWFVFVKGVVKEAFLNKVADLNIIDQFGFMWEAWSSDILQRPRNNLLVQVLTAGQIFQEDSCKHYAYKLEDVCMQHA